MTRRQSLAFALATTTTVAVVVVALWSGIDTGAPAPSTREVDAPVNAYRANPTDPRELELSLMLGLGDQILESSATETASQIIVRVRVRQDLRVKAALGVPTTARVVLREPLDARVVMDATGRTLHPQP